MNVERLHAIVAAMREDLDSTGLVTKVGDLAAVLQSLATQPQEAGYQQQVTTARAAVQEAVSGSDIDEWPATWQETLEELGIRHRLGAELGATISSIFVNNEITPQSASTEIQALADQLTADLANAQNLLSGFEAFGIGAEDLAAGEGEVLVTIPRGAVHENLPDLGKELRELDIILAPFEEIETGSRAPFKVRAIGSSDFGIFLAASPVVAAAIAKTVNWILDSYLKLLQIQLAKQQLVDAGTPDEALAGVEEHANNMMRTAVEEYAGAYLTEKLGEERQDRANELEVSVRVSMNKIANRIDDGYNFDVRVGEPDEVDDGEDGAEPQDEQVTEATATIIDISPQAQVRQPIGSPDTQPAGSAEHNHRRPSARLSRTLTIEAGVDECPPGVLV